MMPIKDGALFTQWLFKVGKGPEPDGSWVIGDSDVDIDLYSAIGGQRFNLCLGTEFGFDYVIPELDLSQIPFAPAEFVGGQQPALDVGSFLDVGIYETFDGPSIPLDVRRSLLQQFPGALISFIDMTPADGITSAQTRMGSVNAGTGTKFYKINYSISIIVSKTDGDLSRRFQGMVLTDQVLAELIDLHACPDGEGLSNPGGIQIRQVFRENGPQDVYKKFFIFTVLVSVMTSITRADNRKFLPWLRTSFVVDNPPPHQAPSVQETIRVAGPIEVDMSSTPDITLDGTFVRASAATYWDGTTLQEWASGVRRVAYGMLLLEPAIPSLGASALDFGTWTAINGSTVDSDATSNPAGSPDDADLILFPLSGALELSGIASTVGQPHTFSIFVRGLIAAADAITLEVDDGISLFTSNPFDVSADWKRISFEVTPNATSVDLRVKNNIGVQTVALWGAQFSNSARWLAEFASASKPKDVLTFYPPFAYPMGPSNTPVEVLNGEWTLRFKTLESVSPDLIGTGLSIAPALVSVNNGATDLLLVTLVGTPDTGGAMLVLYLRGMGAVLTLSNIYWQPGAILEFKFNALGEFAISGTDSHDGVRSISRYDSAALPASDRLVLGSDAGGTRGAVPGFYSIVIDQ
jgi:hypothetical protein